MNINGNVGPLSTTASLSAGTQPLVRLGNMGDMIASELHGRYYEACYRNTVYNGANQSGVTTSVGLATTYVGICLANPFGSSVNLVLNKVGYSFLLAFPAASALGLMMGFNSTTNVSFGTALTPRSSLIAGSGVGQGQIGSNATLTGTPTVSHYFGTGDTGAITTTPMSQGIVDFEGSVILRPGAYVAFYTSTASGASAFVGSMQWEEVPL